MLPEDEKAKLLQQVTEERNQQLQQRQNKVCHQLNEDEGHNRCIAKVSYFPCEKIWFGLLI